MAVLSHAVPNYDQCTGELRSGFGSAVRTELNRIKLIHLIVIFIIIDIFISSTAGTVSSEGAQRELGLSGHCRCHYSFPTTPKNATSVTY